MKYQNLQPTEGLNVTPHNPVLYFLKLMLWGLVFIVAVVVGLNYLGATLAKKIPFHYEAALMERIEIELGTAGSTELTNYLNDLSKQMAEHMPIPEDMEFKVHYNQEDVFNAYATLGGNLVFYRGLLSRMPNENTLAMVMAHEMAHVLHRDPLAGMSGGIASMLAMMMLTGSSGSGYGGDILSKTGTLTQLTFNRDMESAADRAALEALVSYYGHAGGADTLFRIFEEKRGGGDSASIDSDKISDWLGEFSSTHPLDRDRIDSVIDLATENEWPLTGEFTPLPPQFALWLAAGQ